MHRSQVDHDLSNDLPANQPTTIEMPLGGHFLPAASVHYYPSFQNPLLSNHQCEKSSTLTLYKYVWFYIVQLIFISKSSMLDIWEQFLFRSQLIAQWDPSATREEAWLKEFKAREGEGGRGSDETRVKCQFSLEPVSHLAS